MTQPVLVVIAMAVWLSPPCAEAAAPLDENLSADSALFPPFAANATGLSFNKLDPPIYTTVSVIADGYSGLPSGTLQSGDYFGCSIGRIGDVNNDGVEDLVVGAWGDSDAGSNAGAVYVLQMTMQRTVGAAFKITEGQRGFGGDLDAYDFFGTSVDGIGDIDSNGVPDIVVGADQDDDAGAHAGAVYVMLMGPNVQVQATVKITEGQGGFSHALDNNDWFGYSVAGLGDLNGDSVPDIAVGAIRDDTGGTEVGAVYVLLMTTVGTVSATTKITNAMGGLSTTLWSEDFFGERMSGLGDINGDGVPDLAVGASGTDRAGQTRPGAVFVLHLTSSGSVGSSYEITSYTSGFNHGLASNEFFASPSRLGDVDGDGIDDLVVGAWGTNSVYLLLLDGAGFVREIHSLTHSAGGAFGFAVSYLQRERGVSLLVGVPGAAQGIVYVIDFVDHSPSPAPTPSRSPSSPPSVSRSRSPSTSRTPSISRTRTASVSLSPSISRSPTRTRTPTASASLTSTASTSLVSTASASMIPTASAAMTPTTPASMTPTTSAPMTPASASMTRTASASLTPTTSFMTPTASASMTPTASASMTPTASASTTPTTSASMIPTASASMTATASASMTVTASASMTVTASASTTPTASASMTPTASASMAATASASMAATASASMAATASASMTPTTSASMIPTASASMTPTTSASTTPTASASMIPTASASMAATAPSSMIPTASASTTPTAPASMSPTTSASTTPTASASMTSTTTPAPSASKSASATRPPSQSPPLYPRFGTSQLTRITNGESGFPHAELAPGTWFGAAVDSVGDVNDDGVADLAVGAPGCDNGKGCLHFLLRSGHQAALPIQGTTVMSTASPRGLQASLVPGDHFGCAVAGIGDLDSNGFPDLAVGAAGDSGGTGAVYVVLMGAVVKVVHTHKIPSASGVLSWTGEDGGGGGGAVIRGGDGFGSAVSSGGDINGDGVVDLVVGAPGDDDAVVNGGAVYVLLLRNNQTQPVLRLAKITEAQSGFGELLRTNDAFGFAVASAGDLDGNGVPDLFVGAAGDDSSTLDGGSARAVLLQQDGRVASSHQLGAGQPPHYELQAGQGFGVVSVGGDVDGDGVDDLVVGSRFGAWNVSQWHALQVPLQLSQGQRDEVVVVLMDEDARARQSGALEDVGMATTGSGFGWSLSRVVEEGDQLVVVGAPWETNEEGEVIGAVFLLRVQQVTSSSPSPQSPSPSDTPSPTVTAPPQSDQKSPDALVPTVAVVSGAALVGLAALAIARGRLRRLHDTRAAVPVDVERVELPALPTVRPNDQLPARPSVPPEPEPAPLDNPCLVSRS